MCLNRCFLFCSSSYLIFFFLSTCYCSWTHISFLLLFLPVPKTCGQNSKTQPAVFLGFLHNVWSEIDWRAQTVTLINLAITRATCMARRRTPSVAPHRTCVLHSMQLSSAECRQLASLLAHTVPEIE
jgi:hypothetical protein